MEQGEVSAGNREGSVAETYEIQLASELLELNSEAELDRFLGDLLKSAVGAGKSFLNSGAGKAVGGLLKGVAKKALPQLGRAVGDFVAPGMGGQIGSSLGSFVGGQLGLELEGLSLEDREFETARAFVRVLDETASLAAAAPPNAPPATVAVRAATTAAQNNLPGLVPLIKQLSPPLSPPGRPGSGPQRSGTWDRNRQALPWNSLW